MTSAAGHCGSSLRSGGRRELAHSTGDWCAGRHQPPAASSWSAADDARAEERAAGNRQLEISRPGSSSGSFFFLWFAPQVFLALAPRASPPLRWNGAGPSLDAPPLPPAAGRWWGSRQTNTNTPQSHPHNRRKLAGLHGRFVTPETQEDKKKAHCCLWRSNPPGASEAKRAQRAAAPQAKHEAQRTPCLGAGGEGAGCNMPDGRKATPSCLLLRLKCV